MRGHRLRGSMLRLGVVVAAVLGTLWSATSASASCATLIGDPAPGYSGSIQGIACRYEDGPQISWTVPQGITDARFYLRGADDNIGGRGATVAARSPVNPGETMFLEPGAAGEASTVRLGGVALFVAGGGNGKAANYVAPGASEVESQAAGGPIEPAADGTTYIRNGEVDVSWGHFSKDPNWCLVPELRGLRARVARRRLLEANCTVGQVRRHAARPPQRGRVTRQWPRAGTELPPGSSVDLRVGRKG